MATQKEILSYFSKAHATLTGFCLLGAYKSKKPFPLIPPIMLCFPLHYQYDNVYGDKAVKIRETAEVLIFKVPHKFKLPRNNILITPEEYDEIFERTDVDKQKLEALKARSARAN